MVRFDVKSYTVNTMFSGDWEVLVILSVVVVVVVVSAVAEMVSGSEVEIPVACYVNFMRKCYTRDLMTVIPGSAVRSIPMSSLVFAIH